MAPIFSLRSMLGIFLGLIIGVVAGFGYSAFSTTNAQLNSGWPPISITDDSGSSVFVTSVQGRILPVNNDDTFIRNMDLEEQYYAARMGSLHFFQYYSNAISKQYPQYAHTADQLSQKIKVSYVTLADNPAAIEIKAGFTSTDEALFMLQNLPIVFEDYMLNEQNTLQAAAYQQKLKQIDSTRQSLKQAGQDLVQATIDANVVEQTSTITTSKEYLALTARITSLQDALNEQAKQAVTLLGQGVTPAASLPQTSTGATILVNTNPAELDARINGLEQALQQKAWVAAGFTLAAGASGSTLPETVVLAQRYQEALSQQYTNLINSMELTSTELSKARVNMDALQARINQEKLTRTNNNVQKQLAYTLANDQVNNLTAQLDKQTEELQGMSQTIQPSQMFKFYTVRSPSTPAPVETGKNGPIMGAILGIFCGWLVVNRRWLMGSASNPPRDAAPVTTSIGNKESLAIEQRRK